jgi:hypothetical protein
MDTSFVSLLGSALANGVRSPVDPDRDPGLIVPLYNDLKKDVHCRISYTYWKGEDKITETHSDRSTLVAMGRRGEHPGHHRPAHRDPRRHRRRLLCTRGPRRALRND